MAPPATEVLILDTDHMSELARGSAASELLRERLAASRDRRGTTVVTVDELLRGHLAQISAARDNDRLIIVYERLQKALFGLAPFVVLPFDTATATILDKLKERRLRIGTMDLRIASIAIAAGAMLLSRNLRDIRRVPDLNVEDWLS